MNIKKIIFFILILVLVGNESLWAQGIITIDISYKIILNPANGQRPNGVTNADIRQNVDDMNAQMDTYWRGYRFNLVEILEIGGTGDFTGPSKWYNTNFSSTNSFESDATSSPTAYRWRNNSINFYINQGESSAICSFPPDGNAIILGGGSDYYPDRHIHEMGHYFDLCHTQGCPCGGCTDGETGQCHTTPGNDKVGDTLEDLACWDRDDISQNTYNKNYSALTTAQKARVDDVFRNTMSYHNAGINTRVRMTEGQLDRWSDALRSYRTNVADRKCIFVRDGGGFFWTGFSSSPWPSVALGQAAASSGDVLVLRPGNYDEQLTLNKPMSLRATRAGIVVIGSNSSPFSKVEEEALLARLDTAILDQEAQMAEVIPFEEVDFIFDDIGHGHAPDVIRASSEFEIFPNPNHGVFNIRIEDAFLDQNPDASLMIYNQRGEIVFESLPGDSPDLEVNLRSYPKGTYYVKLVGRNAELNIKTLFYQ
ncbi:MAG: T9SS type A sorting domain-containing protein [Bacteroidota bacterium]